MIPPNRCHRRRCYRYRRDRGKSLSEFLVGLYIHPLAWRKRWRYDIEYAEMDMCINGYEYLDRIDDLYQRCKHDSPDIPPTPLISIDHCRIFPTVEPFRSISTKKVAWFFSQRSTYNSSSCCTRPFQINCLLLDFYPPVSERDASQTQAQARSGR